MVWRCFTVQTNRESYNLIYTDRTILQHQWEFHWILFCLTWISYMFIGVVGDVICEGGWNVKFSSISIQSGFGVLVEEVAAARYIFFIFFKGSSGFVSFASLSQLLIAFWKLYAFCIIYICENEIKNSLPYCVLFWYSH